MSDGFRERLLSIGEAGSAHTNTTAASLLPAARKFTLPSYFFDRVGKGLLIRAAGQISTLAIDSWHAHARRDARLGDCVLVVVR